MKKQDPIQVLKKRITEVPTEPGIYRWLNKEGEVLYVGKAKNLRNRLRSYLNGVEGPWRQSLVKQIVDFDVTITTSELEALVLETNLIKKLRPKYNVLMKDDKNYVYVRVSISEDYPRLDVVRRIVEDGARYFGPFLSAYDTHRTLEVLHQIYHFKACRASLDFKNSITKLQPRECLEHQIGRCNGLCISALSKEEHRKNIEEVMTFFKGNRDPAIASLKEMMRKAALDKKFERAAELRDFLTLFAGYAEKQLVSDPSGANTDIVGAVLLSGRASVVVLQQRDGKVMGEHHLNLAGQAENIGDVLEQFLPQYYEAVTDLPETILVAEDFDERELFSAFLTLHKGKSVKVAVPERGKKSGLMELAVKNALMKAKQSESKWESDLRSTTEALQELQTLLGLPNPPKRIECFDISHLGGTETVGSMVVFKDAKPARDHYRSFTLRALKTGDIDDYRSIREVIARRFKYLKAASDQSSVSWKKLKKKEVEQWNEEYPKRMVVAKGWRQEVVVVEEEKMRGGEEREEKEKLMMIDLRRKKGEKMLIGSMELLSKDRELLHQALDLVEKKIGKDELYVFSADRNARDILALHGFFLASDGFEKLPKVLRDSSIEADLYHRQKSAQKADPSFKAAPDLIVIDGGKGQLNSAMDILRTLEVTLPAIGLAKREEEIFIQGQSDPVIFPKDSPGKFLLMRLRDEAHRFANEHREVRGKKRAVASALDSVPGIGPKTKKDLLKKFGTVQAVQEASDAALAEVVTGEQLMMLRQHL